MVSFFDFRKIALWKLFEERGLLVDGKRIAKTDYDSRCHSDLGRVRA